MSIKSVSVAEAKRSFSELMARVVYKGDVSVQVSGFAWYAACSCSGKVEG